VTAADTALQLVRSCLKQAYGLTDSQVIKADVRGPRPALPYLTVRIGSANVPIGEGLEIVQFPLSRATVALDDPGTVYTLTIDGDDYTYTSTADDTADTIAQALALAVQTAAVSVATTDGADVLIYDDTGTVTVTGDANITVVSDTSVEVYREGVYTTVTVQGFGTGADTWLEGFSGALQRPDVAALQGAAGMDIEVNGGLLNVAALLDTAYEPRWAREFQASYTVVHLGTRAAASGGNPIGSPIIVPLVPLQIVEIGYIGATDDSDADPVTFTITQDVP